jgi:hypothetical protein
MCEDDEDDRFDQGVILAKLKMMMLLTIIVNMTMIEMMIVT